VLGGFHSQIDSDLSKEVIAFIFKVRQFNLKKKELRSCETYVTV
jgi:hypothetical protein